MEYADVSEKPASSFSGVCLHFEPQKWRKTKCKTCFEDAKKHKYVKVYGVTSGEINDEISNDLDANEPRNCTESFSECYEDSYWKELEKADGLFPENTRDEMGSKRDRPFSQNRPLPATEDCTLHLKTENELSRSDALDMNNSSHTQEVDSPIMARKHSRTLSRNSTLEYSSTSSLDALEDANTTSSLSHGFSADTLDSLGLTSGDELDSMDNVLDFVPSRKVSDLKVVELQQELESLRDTQKAVEAGKDKHIQGLEREIQNLRLELTNFSARENVLMLKNRLELEGKSLRISDLENEVQHLKSTIASITLSRTSDEDSHDKLQGNIHRCNQRIKSLEEENKTLQERISLAEDLQTNDRELLDVLRNQLNVLERDLLVSQEKCRNLEDRIKTYKEIESDLSDERVKNSELTKQMEFLNEKIKKRDRLMSCLEDDNVKLEHLMKEFKDKTRKDQSVIEKLDEKVKVLQQNITECNDAIERLSNENKVLEHEHWHETIKQADVSNSVQNYIEQLEEKTRQMELKLKELENENDHLVSEISELLENSVIMNTECENLKGQLRKAENETNDLKELREEQDKKITVMQRKLKKADKEKKRIQMEKTKLEAQLIDLKTDYEKVAKFEDLEKGYRMIELKLQSTEAKLTMIEGNKTYLESKLAEYEKKSFSVEEILNKINLIINSHILDSIEESVTGDQSVYFENKSLEEKLGKILKDKKENQQLLSIVKERNCSLTETIASLERQLDESKNQLNCFITENKQLKVELDEKSLLLMNLKNFLQLGLQQLIKQNNVLENKVTEITKLSTATTILESHLKSERHRAACGRLETWSYKNQLQKYEEKYDRLKEDQHQLLIHIEYLSKLNQLLQLSVHTLEKENAKLSVSSTKQKEIVSLERSRGKKEIIKHDKPSSKQRERRQSSEKERKRNSRLVAPDSVKQPNDITDCELLVLNSDSKATNQEDIHDFDTLDKLEGIKSAFIEIPQTKFPSNDDAGGNPSQSSILADTQSTSEAMSHNEVKSSTCAETSAPESFLLDDCLPLKNASNPISHGSFSLKDCLVADTGNGVSDTNTNSMFIDNEILIDTTENVEQSSENEEGTIVLNTTEKEAPFFELQQIRSKENKRASDEDSKSDGQKATRHWDNLSISKICDFEQLINSADRISKKIIKEASVLYVEGKNKIEHQENSTKEQSMGTPGQGNKTRIISSKEGEGSIKEREDTEKMEYKRPLTSVKCIFEVQPLGPKSDKPSCPCSASETASNEPEVKLSVRDMISKYGANISVKPKEEIKSAKVNESVKPPKLKEDKQYPTPSPSTSSLGSKQDIDSASGNQKITPAKLKDDGKSPSSPRHTSPLGSPRVSRIKPIKLNSALAVFEKQQGFRKTSKPEDGFRKTSNSEDGFRSRSISDSSLIKRNRPWPPRQSNNSPPPQISGSYIAKCESDTVKLLQQASGGITLTIESSKIQKLDDNKEDTDDSETFNERSLGDDNDIRLPPLTPLFDRPRSGGRKPPSKVERTRWTTDVSYFDFSDV